MNNTYTNILIAVDGSKEEKPLKSNSSRKAQQCNINNCSYR